MFYLTTAKSFSFHDIFMSMSQPKQQNQDTECWTVDPEKYFASFALDTISEVDKNMPHLETAVVAAGLTLSAKLPTIDDNSVGRISRVEMISHDRGSAVVTYRVTIGRIAVTVIMLNVAHKATREGKRVISMGSFGEILQVPYEQGNYVCKRVFFRTNERILTSRRDMMNWVIQANNRQIREIVEECAFSKICSALKVGPQQPPLRSFDVICYENAVQFSMEKCESLKGSMTNITQFEERMHYCLRVLHSFGIIHKDIKPDNMAYSPTLQDYVFVDFGISQWVRESPGSLSWSYREGTFQFMSPEMKKVNPGKRSMVDLYWNDIFALKRSIEVVSTFPLVQRKVQFFSSTQSVPIETKLFAALWRIHTSGNQFPKQLCQMSELNQLHIKAVLAYFPEWEGDDTSRQKASIESIALNIQFAIRAFGSNIELICHLKPFAAQQKVDKLLRKLTSDHCLMETLKKRLPNRLINSSVLLEFYDRLLKHCECNPQQESENALEQTAVLFRIADVYLTLQKGEMQSIQFFERIVKLESKLSEEQPWNGYANWIAQLFKSFNELPANTSTLFGGPLNANLRRLLIKCTMVKYSRGYYKAAFGLCSYLLNGSIKLLDYQSKSTSESRQVVCIMERLLQDTHRSSEEWVVLATFVWSELIKLSEVDYFITQYAVMVSQLDGQPKSSLLSLLAFAYTRKGNLRLALHSCLECLTIRKNLSVIDINMLTREFTLLISLYRRLGDTESALEAARQIPPALLMESEAKLRVQQEIFVCLFQSGKIEEALQLLDSIESQLCNLREPLSTFSELMTHHLTSVKLALSWEQNKVKNADSFNKLTTHIISVLDEAKDETRFGIKRLQLKLEMLLALAAVQLSCKDTKTALQVFDRAMLTIVSQASKIIYGQTECSEVLLREGPNHSKVQELIRDSGLAIYVYQIKMGQLLATSQFEGFTQLMNTANKAMVCRGIDMHIRVKQFLRFICEELHKNGRDTVCLELLSFHERVSEIDQHFLKACLLIKVNRFQEGIQLLEALVNRCGEEDLDRAAEAHRQLAQAFRKLPEPNIERSQEHQQQVASMYYKLHQRAPENKQIWLNIGVLQLQLGNTKEALRWLQRFQRSQQDVSKKSKETGIIIYAVCLNHLGRCSQSLHFFLKALQARPDASRRAECLFYLAHNSYVLRRQKQLSKWSSMLLATDGQQQHAKAFIAFLQGKNRRRRLQIISKATGWAIYENSKTRNDCIIPHGQPKNLSDFSRKLVSAKKVIWFQRKYIQTRNRQLNPKQSGPQTSNDLKALRSMILRFN